MMKSVWRAILLAFALIYSAIGFMVLAAVMSIPPYLWTLYGFRLFGDAAEAGAMSEAVFKCSTLLFFVALSAVAIVTRGKMASDVPRWAMPFVAAWTITMLAFIIVVLTAHVLNKPMSAIPYDNAESGSDR